MRLQNLKEFLTASFRLAVASSTVGPGWQCPVPGKSNEDIVLSFNNRRIAASACHVLKCNARDARNDSGPEYK